jgi:hypothetical protein
MTKRKAKPIKKGSVARAAAAKTSATKKSVTKKSATKKSATPTTNGAALIVLGFDDRQKPVGARFDHDKPDLVTKAAEVMGLKVYKASHPEVAALAQKLAAGRLYANGRGFVPNIRQTLYSDLIGALARKPEALLSGTKDSDVLPPARGLPASWDEIGPGHLVIAHESPTHGWREAIVLDRKNGSFTLRFRDYPTLPKFVRDRFGIGLMYPAPEAASGLCRAWEDLRPGHLVLAHESPEDGWWEATVVEAKDDAFTLQFRDYPDLPNIVRHRSGVALMYSPTMKEGQPATPPQQA